MPTDIIHISMSSDDEIAHKIIVKLYSMSDANRIRNEGSSSHALTDSQAKKILGDDLKLAYLYSL
jgi:hypothetical protein